MWEVLKVFCGFEFPQGKEDHNWSTCFQSTLSSNLGKKHTSVTYNPKTAFPRNTQRINSLGTGDSMQMILQLAETSNSSIQHHSWLSVLKLLLTYLLLYCCNPVKVDQSYYPCITGEVKLQERMAQLRLFSEFSPATICELGTSHTVSHYTATPLKDIWSAVQRTFNIWVSRCQEAAGFL